MEGWIESDRIVEKWIQENDKTFMTVPSIESEPHLLISKVRKHYMEYLIKLLAVNYENNQKLLNKNIYLPSAIWRCAKMIEMSAAQASMVVHLYRKSITDVIQGVKKSTNKGALYRKLYDCLHYAPENEKKVQTNMASTKNCNCQCSCNQRKKVKRMSESPTQMNENQTMNIAVNPNNIIVIEPQTDTTVVNNTSPKPNIRTSIDMPDSDDLMLQLDKLFQGDENDDDLFDSALCMTDKTNDDNTMQPNAVSQEFNLSNQQDMQESQKCLDDRLALISGLIVNTNESALQDSDSNKVTTKPIARTSKWLCEEYFQKVRLYELLDQIRDYDRKKYAKVKERLIFFFGEDSEDEGVVSPLEETHEFISSCKERIAPWIVKILTPYYVKGRIRGKTLFKSLVKHLIRLIYQCSKYPQEYEVQSFVKDFLDTHKLIRCEADFKQFRIENYLNMSG